MKGPRMLESEELVLRNTFVNAQMGPLADFRSHHTQPQRPPKLKWVDNGEDNKQKLRTNNSEDDLICKLEEDQVPEASNHRKAGKTAAKSTIKPFKQTLSEVTGVPLSSYNTVRSSRNQEAKPASERHHRSTKHVEHLQEPKKEEEP